MRKIIIFLVVAFAPTIFTGTGFAQEQPKSAVTVEFKEREDTSKEKSWELYGGTGFASAIIYNNGRVAYKGLVQQFRFGGEKEKSERVSFFVEGEASKRLTSRSRYSEGGDEIELKLGIRGEDDKFDYQLAVGYRKAYGEEDVVMLEAELGAPIKVSKNASLKPSLRFVGEVPANSEAHHRSAVIGGGINYLQTFPGKKLFVETSVALLGGTGIEERGKVLRSDICVALGTWKGPDFRSSKFALKPYVRLTGRYFSTGITFSFGKRK